MQHQWRPSCRSSWRPMRWSPPLSTGFVSFSVYHYVTEPAETNLTLAGGAAARKGGWHHRL